MAQIKVALGGRVAEEIVFGDITTGAESDIQQLTGIARHMVGRWGMSRGDRPDRRAPDGRAEPVAARASQRLRGDPAAGRRGGPPHRRGRPRDVSDCCARTAATSTRSSKRLLEHETLDEAEAYAAAGLPGRPAAGPDTRASTGEV